MLPWSIVWFAGTVVFVAVEAATAGLVSIWFAAGALCAMLTALATDNFWTQMAVFLAVSALCLAALRPLCQRMLGRRGRQPTNADQVIGMEAVVTQAVDNLAAQGAVQVKGMTWTARSEDGAPIPAGERVKVLRIEGVKLFVAPVQVPAAKSPF